MPNAIHYPDHPRRCHAIAKSRKRCGRWALVTSDYCEFHGGRRSTHSKTGKRRLPSYYSKYLGPKLKDRIEELLNKPHDEQVALYEELALARATAAEALLLAAPLWDGTQSEKLNPDVRALMVQTLSQAMNNVKDLVLAASRIEKEAGDKVSIKVINLIVLQIISAINDVCGTENLDIAKAIEAAIEEKVRLPLNDRLNPKVNVQLT